MKKILSSVTYVAIAILIGITVSFAGSLTPPGSPSKTMKSLADLYQLINTGSNTPANDFTTPGTVSSTMNTLGDIYDLMTTKIAAIDTTKILTGTTIFGKAGSAVSGYAYGDSNQAYVLGTATGAGTALKNMYNGTSGTVVGGDQANGGKDDYNPLEPPSNRYVGLWTTCDVGNNYCNTSDSGAMVKDNTTGLIWSYFLDSNGTNPHFTIGSPANFSFYQANNCQFVFGDCIKKTSSKTGCDAITGWYLPHQKQLMQAYIDGSYGNLYPGYDEYRSFWSATVSSSSSSNAWYVNLSDGESNDQQKSNSFNVLCVR